jgi:hypothetical protein
MAVGTGTAILGGAVIGGLAGLYASNRAAGAQTDAATAAASATREATAESVAESRRQYDLARADLAPWRETGVNALKVLVDKINAGPGDYTQSPGYQFRLSEGEKAVNRSAAAKGGALSGATTKALARYGQDYATADYDNYLRRYYESLNPLQSLAQVGQTSSAQTASTGAQTASNIANATMQGASGVSNALITGGNAAATGAINAANSLTGGINSGINNYLMWKYLDKKGVLN